MTNLHPANGARREAVDAYWETFPPLWLRIRGFIRQAADEFDLSVEQFNILRHIRDGRCSVSDLAEVRNTSRPAVSQAVDLLVARGFVNRKPDPHDRRHVWLTLTELGSTCLDEMFVEIHQRMLRIFAHLTDAEVQNLQIAMAALKRIQSL